MPRVDLSSEWTEHPRVRRVRGPEIGAWPEAVSSVVLRVWRLVWSAHVQGRAMPPRHGPRPAGWGQFHGSVDLASWAGPLPVPRG